MKGNWFGPQKSSWNRGSGHAFQGGRGRGRGGHRGHGRGRGRGGGYPWWEHLPGGSRHSGKLSSEEKERRMEQKHMNKLYGTEAEELMLPVQALGELRSSAAILKRNLEGNLSCKSNFGATNSRSIPKEVLTTMTSCVLNDQVLFNKLRIQQSSTDSSYCQVQSQTAKLPIAEFRRKIALLIESNQIVVISGETGCGKTTQVPQLILDFAIQNYFGSKIGIICTQPRRISAVSIAQRVASERGENVGETVGYQIRLEKQISGSTQLVYCTTGILLRRLQIDPELEGCSHVIIDEVHERTLETDFLLIILKDLLARRSSLKLIVMSATLNAECFSQYLGNCPILHVPGFTFPVEQYFLEDALEITNHQIRSLTRADIGKSNYRDRQFRKRLKQFKEKERMNQEQEVDFDEIEAELLQSGYSQSTIASVQSFDESEIPFDLIKALVCRIHQTERQGAILIFMPGWSDISKLHNMLKECRESLQWQLYALHSQMPSAEQQSIFLPPPFGKRKIVISTNIAESSITIDDVVFVIDSGKHKEKSYKPEAKLASLLPAWISKASAIQRKGRAGRVQPGKCWHLYPKSKYQTLEMYQEPEMTRSPLNNLCLQVTGMGLSEQGCGGIWHFLMKALSPPSECAVLNSTELLTQIGAMNVDESLTSLGGLLLQLPIEPQIGKALIYACLLGCLDPVLTIASILSTKSPFQMPLEQKDAADQAKRRFAEGEPSDHFAFLRAFQEWEIARRKGQEGQFCYRNFLSSSTMRMVSDMRKQFSDLLSSSGILGERANRAILNRHSGQWPVVKAAICAGLFPNIVRVDFGKRRATLISLDYRKPELHPGSVIAKSSDTIIHRWLFYNEIVQNIGGIFIYDASEISPLPLLLFGTGASDHSGHLLEIEDQGPNVVGIKDWVYFSVEPGTKHILEDCRYALSLIIQERIGQYFDDMLPAERNFMDTVARAIVSEHEASDLYA